MNKLILSFLAGFALSSTFRVDNVTTAETSIYKEMSLHDKLRLYQALETAKVEAVSSNSLINSKRLPRELAMNGLLEAVHLAYSQHHGLTLSPEKMFITILQGVAIHINQNPEKHRAALGIKHDGKVQLGIRYDNMTLGSTENNWPLVFNTFKRMLGGFLPEDIFSQLEKPFTTSTDLSVVVTSITIMDSFKAYFEYILSTLCGIPEVTLQGTPEDWIDLKNRAQNLLQRLEGLDKWEATLVPVLDQFISASQGKPDVEFWKSIYKLRGISGFPDVSGWINAFFPYLQFPNKFHINTCAHGSLVDCPKYSLSFYPVGFTRTPFKWNYYNSTFDMEILAGLVGVEKNDTTNHVQPALGWAVLHAEA
ncbi:hypothetical protein DSO57_1005918 [Entomophthora muscae]|uniref:Uncharacterized protein n=1 Tax=Entomophthora muscae TaxID=34485 RepID=A0ACC2S9U8_9FUNG|nr:hypothetical protein DSO57_1005918 [Entomophthora muscae]